MEVFRCAILYPYQCIGHLRNKPRQLLGNENAKIDTLGDTRFLKIQPYQLAALALSLGVHVWLGHALAIRDGVHDAQNSNLGTSSNILMVRLTKSNHVADSQAPVLAKFNSLNPKDSFSHSLRVGGEPIPVLSPPDPYYFRSHELTNPPRLLQDVRATQNLNLSDTLNRLVVLRLLVSDSGDIDRVVVEESDLPAESTLLLVEKFSKMKFNPGKIDNSPVKSQLTIEVEVGPSE
jgi:hypothetical protein